LNNLKLVWHIREFIDLDLNKKFRNYKKSINLINKANTIIAISDSVKEYFKKELPNTNIVRVYNGIDNQNYIDSRNQILDNKEFVITLTGRFVPSKGFEEAIVAINNLLKLGYNIKLQIVGNEGDKSYKKYLKSLINKYGINDSIVFLGYVS